MLIDDGLAPCPSNQPIGEEQKKKKRTTEGPINEINSQFPFLKY